MTSSDDDTGTEGRSAQNEPPQKQTGILPGATAEQGRFKRRPRGWEELQQVALTAPAARTQEEVERLAYFLATVYMLKSVQPSVLRSVAQCVAGRMYQEQDLVYAQGDAADHFYVVVYGHLQLYERERVGDVVENFESMQHGERDSFGETDMLTQQPHQQRAVALAPTLLLTLEREEYLRMLQGRHSKLLEQKLQFLMALPIFSTVPAIYMSAAAHCFSQLTLEPREMLVRQGAHSDCIYVITSGQLCVLVDPHYIPSSDPTHLGECDLKKVVQVCVLGSGNLIGDMSLGETARRTATVVALTEVSAYKIAIPEFKRRMPHELLETMKRVAQQKAAMNGHQLDKKQRAADQGLQGHVMLGDKLVPERVLHGRHLRTLLSWHDKAQEHSPDPRAVGQDRILDDFLMESLHHVTQSSKRQPPGHAELPPLPFPISRTRSPSPFKPTVTGRDTSAATAERSRSAAATSPLRAEHYGDHHDQQQEQQHVDCAANDLLKQHPVFNSERSPLTRTRSPDPGCSIAAAERVQQPESSCSLHARSLAGSPLCMEVHHDPPPALSKKLPVSMTDYLESNVSPRQRQAALAVGVVPALRSNLRNRRDGRRLKDPNELFATAAGGSGTIAAGMTPGVPNRSGLQRLPSQRANRTLATRAVLPMSTSVANGQLQYVSKGQLAGPPSHALPGGPIASSPLVQMLLQQQQRREGQGAKKPSSGFAGGVTQLPFSNGLSLRAR